MSYLKSIIYKTQRRFFKSIIKSKNAWQIFNEAGIEGFGTNLLRLYFPVYYDKKKERDSFSGDVKKQFTSIFDNALDKHRFAAMINSSLAAILLLQVREDDPALPHLDNYYFGVLDAALLGAMLKRFKPTQVVEIGSGISSRYIRYFKDLYTLDTKLICIDPAPRADIGHIADVIITEPLEAIVDSLPFNLKSGDIIFMDGSHYTFQGNDTLTFFFKLMPALPSGVIIHIHDIYLPFDYAENVTSQLWTEQYLLAAMLLGGFKGYEVLYPAYYASQNIIEIKEILADADRQLKNNAFKLRTNHTEGFSFWMKKL